MQVQSPRSHRRNGYGGQRPAHRSAGAELGTPQKRVRRGKGPAVFLRHAESGTVSAHSPQKRVRRRRWEAEGDPGLEPFSAWITHAAGRATAQSGGKPGVNGVYRPGRRRNGYALRGLRCGKACGNTGLSPQKPVRAVRRYRFGAPQIRVRPFAESSTVVRRFGFARVVFFLTNQGAELHVYGLQVVNPYRYRLLVVTGLRTVDNPCGLPTVRPPATSRESPRTTKPRQARPNLSVPVSA